MDAPKSYKTKQREIILDFIIRNKDRHITADELLEHLKAEGNSVGKSTVYRYLEKLVQEGKLKKYYLEEGMSACYQYADGENCCEHYHFKCKVCGELFHVECGELKGLSEHIFEHHGFLIDLSKTIIYGVCKKCKGDTENEKNHEKFDGDNDRNNDGLNNDSLQQRNNGKQHCGR